MFLRLFRLYSKTCLKVSSCWLKLCSAYEHSFGSLTWILKLNCFNKNSLKMLLPSFRNRDCCIEVVPMLQTSVYSFRNMLKNSGLAPLGLSCFLRTGGRLLSSHMNWVVCAEERNPSYLNIWRVPTKGTQANFIFKNLFDCQQEGMQTLSIPENKDWQKTSSQRASIHIEQNINLYLPSPKQNKTKLT